MDKKARLLLDEYHRIFLGKNFVEHDVLGFFIFVREYISDSTIKELCDFIAHRNRDRGTTYEFAEKINDAFQIRDSHIPTEADIFYSNEHIGKVINDFFISHDLQKLNSPIIIEIITCLVCILQEIPIMKKDGTFLCKLTVQLFGGYASLGARFEVLMGVTMTYNLMSVPYQMKHLFADDTETICKIERHDGKIKLVDCQLSI